MTALEIMKKVDAEYLHSKHYTIYNGQLVKASISEINGIAIVEARVDFAKGGSCSLGGKSCGQYNPGHKQVRGCAYGFECLLWLMAVAGVNDSSELGGQYVRVAFDKEDKCSYIGHIYEERWFSFELLAEEHKGKEK